MASHNRTPKSVLEAPKLEPVVLVPHPGYNREMFRKMGSRSENAFPKPSVRMSDRKKAAPSIDTLIYFTEEGERLPISDPVTRRKPVPEKVDMVEYV